VQRFAITSFTEVIREGVASDESGDIRRSQSLYADRGPEPNRPDKTVKLSDSVLERSSGETPFMFASEEHILASAPVTCA
jgi:hypothetical protein